MPANLIVGDDGANTLRGTSAADLIYGFDPNGPQGQVSTIDATRVATGLRQPVFATAPPDDLSRLFIVDKQGEIKILDLQTGEVESRPFLDVRSLVSGTNEQGLLGLAFDPNFAQNGYVYVNYSNTSGDSEIHRYQVSATNPNQIDPASDTLIIRVDQPTTTNHKAGWLGFGPDGDLYAAFGDGGGQGDPNNNAQNVDVLLGKMLRLDVHSDGFPNDPDRNYAIPSDNPFADGSGSPEIYALGLRNPFRDSFDRGTGDFYIADVGQNQWEEIDQGALGANYGWKHWEGPSEYSPGTPLSSPATFPIYAYDHSVGHAVIGGYVYRGPSEGLQGDYFFGDEVAGKIFTLHFDGSSWTATERTSQIVTDAGTIDNPSSFGEDGAGNLYVVDLDGEVYRLTPQVTSADQGDVINGRGGDDMIFGGSGDDRLTGGDGNDTLQGGNGADRLSGSNGNDVLVGGAGNDVLNGGAGTDAMAGGAGDDRYYVDNAADTVTENAGEGDDTVFTSVSYRLAAGSEVEHLRANAGSTGLALTGNQLANQIDGGAGNDVLNGGAGDDVLRGNAGNDRLLGGAGHDVMSGGAGADTFIFRSAADAGLGATRDRITDFSDSEDHVNLSGFGVAFDFIGSAAFDGHAGELRAYQVGGNTIVAGDLDGNRTADFQIALNGVHNLSQSSFLV